MNQEIKNIFLMIDVPDPDNFALIAMTRLMYPDAKIHISVTGRETVLYPVGDTPNYKGTNQEALFDQLIACWRVRNFWTKAFGIDVNVYDGGIAPSTLVPHYKLLGQDGHWNNHIGHLDVFRAFKDVHVDQYINADLAMSPIGDLVEVVKEIENNDEKIHVVVGGPMTGLKLLLKKYPQASNSIAQVTAMFGMWGEKATGLDFGEKRGAKQFNVACDIDSAKFVLEGLECPIYLFTTDVTRDKRVSFANAGSIYNFLGDKNSVSEALISLYQVWDKQVVQQISKANLRRSLPPELIYIHDICSVIGLDNINRKKVYKMVPVQVDVPNSLSSSNEWGVMNMTIVESSNINASLSYQDEGPKEYLKIFREAFMSSEKTKSVTDTGNRVVFISASLPKGSSENDKIKFESTIKNIARRTLNSGSNIIFGGHPTVTPIFHELSKEGNFKDKSVTLCLLSRFEKDIPEEYLNNSLFDIHWVGNEKNDINEDLTQMRLVMSALASDAIFLGGMSQKDSLTKIPGILQEYQIFKDFHQGVEVFLLGDIKGEAKRIIEGEKFTYNGISPELKVFLGDEMTVDSDWVLAVSQSGEVKNNSLSLFS